MSLKDKEGNWSPYRITMLTLLCAVVAAIAAAIVALPTIFSYNAKFVAIAETPDQIKELRQQMWDMKHEVDQIADAVQVTYVPSTNTVHSYDFHLAQKLQEHRGEQ